MADISRVSLILALLVTIAGESVLVFGQAAPAYLPETMRSKFETYTQRPLDRAFALGRDGWGSAYGRSSPRKAREDALANCREFAERCVVIAENDEIVRPEDPFPETSDSPAGLDVAADRSGRTVFLLAGIGLVLLVGGTVIAERYPLYLFSTGVSDVLKIRMNYTVAPFGVAYFLCMLPVFLRAAQGDFSNPLTWFAFAAPIFPYMFSVLYLYDRGMLVDRFEVE